MNDQARQLTPNNPAPVVSFEHQLQLANAFAQSGMFGIKTQEQALALMALCEAEGLHPATAMRDYNIIQGKPAMKADAMLARFQTAGGKVKWIELNDERVIGEFSHPSGGTVRIDWDIPRAQRAGLANKDNWKKNPRAMLRSRVVSEGIRAVFPGVVTGVYTPEEVQDFDDAPPPQPRDITPPEYPNDSFEENLPKWAEYVAAGKKTPEQIINTVSSKYRLTDEQKQKILDLAEGGAE